jgi:hypothetical protein
MLLERPYCRQQLKMASYVLRQEVVKQLESIPFSSDTSRRTSDVASNVKEQLIEKTKVS